MAHPSPPQRPFGRRRDLPRVTIAARGRERTYTVRPWLAGTMLSAAAVFALGFCAAAAYLAYRDDIVKVALASQVEIQYAYEDRIALLRSEIDRVTSRHIMAAQSIEEQVAGLVERQRVIARRQELLENLIATARSEGVEVAASAVPIPTPRPASADAPPAATPAPVAATPALAYAPSGSSEIDMVTGSVIRARPAAEPAPAAPALPGDVKPLLKDIHGALDRTEAVQDTALAALHQSMAGEAERLTRLARRLGIEPPGGKGDGTEGVGGPFVPATGFADRLVAAGDAAVALKSLRRAMVAWPIRAPIPGAPPTSLFGYRTDPFLGRPAMHSGVDFRSPSGTPVRATASGRVVAAGWQGGYGKMVEIDHGNGLTTRYGHLSAIHVADGEAVEAGEVVGAVGSTGRSTGPHLHYETRRGGDAMDPGLFLAAASAL